MRPVIPVLLALALTACPKAAPDAAVDTRVASAADRFPADAEMPTDPDVRIGTLDNGFTYYIEKNDEPDDRAVLRLVLDAGSVLEDEDQLGLAHLLEHMAFNGSEHFDGNELIDVMQAMGMQFGAHVNAHTSFDETVYKLTVPTDDPALIDKSMLVFQDWAGGMTLDHEEIEKERGVVIEEWRLRLGAGKRISDQTLPAVFHGSPYADRLPIGTQASLETFKPEAVERFYKDWYRPDLMAFVAVGDFDVDQMEARIKRSFSGLENPSEPRERVRPDLPAHDPIYLVIADPELPGTSVQVSLKHDDVESNTHGSYRRKLMEGLVSSILNERLGRVARQADAPFLGAGLGGGRLTPTESASTLGVGAREGEALPAYEAALIEVERLKRFGVTRDELDRARTNTLRYFEGAMAEAENESSDEAAAELIRVFTTGETMPGLAYEAQLVEAFLPEFTVEEVSALAAGLVTDGSRIVTVLLPEKEGLIPPTVDEVKAVEARVAAMELEAPQEAAAVGAPVDAPEPGSIVATDDSLKESLGFTRWTLSNGIDVYWKETDFKDDEVVFRGTSPGGFLQHPIEDLVPAMTATSILDRSGVGRLDVDGLIAWTAGKQFDASASVGHHRETMGGSASPKDLEAALTYLYARVTAPRFDATAFELEKQSQAETLRNADLTPSARFYKAWTEAMYPGNPVVRQWTPEDLEAMDRAKSEAIYRDRMADLHDMDFVFVGNLPDDFERLVTTWVATLPGGEREETIRDLGYRPKDGRVEVETLAGTDPRASVRLMWHGDFPEPDYLKRNRLYAVETVLSERLREELREEKSGVYGVGVRTHIGHEPIPNYSLSISFSCDPERVDELVAEALKVVEEVKTSPVDDAYIEEVKAARRRGREEDLRRNSFWASTLLGALERGEDPVEAIDGYAGRVDSLTASDVREAAAAYLGTENFATGVLKPE